MINSGRFKMPKFNMGGLVSSMMMPTMPRVGYADGGEVTSPKSLRPMPLNIFGQDFGTVYAPEDVSSKLVKYSVARQNKSAGRKPDWMGRGRN
jgi:hypothetical protein